MVPFTFDLLLASVFGGIVMGVGLGLVFDLEEPQGDRSSGSYCQQVHSRIHCRNHFDGH